MRDKATNERSCCNCVRWKENLDECQFVREQGLIICEFWPENNLSEKGERHD